jgi:hypothetical protein
MQTGVEFERAILAPQGLSSQILVQQIINLYQLSLHSGKFTNRRWCCSISPLETLSGLLLSIQYLVVFWPWKSKKKGHSKKPNRLIFVCQHLWLIDPLFLSQDPRMASLMITIIWVNSARRVASLMITIMVVIIHPEGWQV